MQAARVRAFVREIEFRSWADDSTPICSSVSLFAVGTHHISVDEIGSVWMCLRCRYLIVDLTGV
jgi:hypothetical protein